MTRCIGGYPALELKPQAEYHRQGIGLNSARCCLEVCLKARGVRKVWLPDFTCSAMLEPIRRLGIEYDRYGIGYDLEPVEVPDLADDEAFVYTNYFDLKRRTVIDLVCAMGHGLIVDNAQAFYARPTQSVDTIYSPRKFFGVSDGGYLYCDAHVEMPEATDESASRMLPQLKRLDTGAESGYADFRHSEETLDDMPPMRMSRLTRSILASVDYDWAAGRRRRNFRQLAEALDGINGLGHVTSRADDECVPMVYPLLVAEPQLRGRLIAEKIFTATYWPNVLEETSPDDPAHHLASCLIPLPVDQSLGRDDMLRIVETIKKNI